MGCFIRGCNEDVICESETIFDSVNHFIDETLKCVSGVSESEGHADELKESEGCCDCSLFYVVRVHGYLMIRFHQVEIGKDFGSSKVER